MKNTIVLIVLLTLVGALTFNYFNSETMMVNYSRSTEELIKAGNYEGVYIHSNNYMVKRSGPEKLKIKLFKFHTSANQYPEDDVLKAISDDGYRIANIQELLHYKILNPTPGINVLALGSAYTNIAGYKNSPFIEMFVDKDNQLKYRLTETGPRLGYYSANNLGEIAFLAVKQ